MKLLGEFLIWIIKGLAENLLMSVLNRYLPSWIWIWIDTWFWPILLGGVVLGGVLDTIFFVRAQARKNPGVTGGKL